MSVNTMLTSPMAKGLFARAVVMSGGNGTSLMPATLQTAEKTGAEFAASKGVVADDPQALAKLRALSAETVTDGLNMMKLFTPGPRTFSSPFPDGKVAVEPAKAIAAGQFAHVPVMIGATSADIGGKTGYMVAGARQLAGALADQVCRCGNIAFPMSRIPSASRARAMPQIFLSFSTHRSSNMKGPPRRATMKWARPSAAIS
jgi:para-nitrobenzyl esterase